MRRLYVGVLLLVGALALTAIHDIVRRLGPALGVVGVLNVQLAVSDDAVFVLSGGFPLDLTSSLTCDLRDGSVW